MLKLYLYLFKIIKVNDITTQIDDVVLKAMQPYLNQ
jgi:hypothetical protein